MNNYIQNSETFLGKAVMTRVKLTAGIHSTLIKNSLRSRLNSELATGSLATRII